MSEAYRTHRDIKARTNTAYLLDNFPRTNSEVKTKILPPHNGFVTANVDVVYTLNELPVLTRQCQIIMRPDKSELTIQTSERFFAAADLGRHNFEFATITREQFLVMVKLFGYTLELDADV